MRLPSRAVSGLQSQRPRTRALSDERHACRAGLKAAALTAGSRRVPMSQAKLGCNSSPRRRLVFSRPFLERRLSCSLQGVESPENRRRGSNWRSLGSAGIPQHHALTVGCQFTFHMLAWVGLVVHSNSRACRLKTAIIFASAHAEFSQREPRHPRKIGRQLDPRCTGRRGSSLQATAAANWANRSPGSG
jgi:hypothetical protein